MAHFSFIFHVFSFELDLYFDRSFPLIICLVLYPQGAEVNLVNKEPEIAEFSETTKQLLTSATPGGAPPIKKDLEKLTRQFSSVQAKLKDMTSILETGLADLQKLHALMKDMYKTMDELDDCIAKSSEALDGDETELENCLKVRIMLSCSLVWSRVAFAY